MTAEPAEVQPKKHARPRRILLAEDGLVNQKVARELLEARGHQVVVANNGREAVEAVERESFDLVLMDVQMPEMDGLEATEAIREKEQQTGRHIPIYAMTARAMKGDREQCIRAGMDAYLTKPIQFKALYDLIDGVAAEAGIDTLEAADTALDTGVMDWNAAVDRIGGREDLLRQMVGLFYVETDKLMLALREAIAQQDKVRVRRAAHSIKGSASCFAAPPAVGAAMRLEFMGRDGDLAGADEAYGMLTLELDRLKQALRDYSPGGTLPGKSGKR